MVIDTIFKLVDLSSVDDRNGVVIIKIEHFFEYIESICGPEHPLTKKWFDMLNDSKRQQKLTDAENKAWEDWRVSLLPK